MTADAGFCLFATPLGDCGIAWRGALIAGVQLPEVTRRVGEERMRARFPQLQEQEPPPWVRAAIERIRAALEGAADDLADLPLDMDGVGDFNQRVYAIARAIPPGRTRTYGDIARELGDVSVARAVGQALGHNPFAPVVPCHRILAANAASGGFSAEGGVATKLRMLQVEHARFGEHPGLFD